MMRTPLAIVRAVVPDDFGWFFVFVVAASVAAGGKAGGVGVGDSAVVQKLLFEEVAPDLGVIPLAHRSVKFGAEV